MVLPIGENSWSSSKAQVFWHQTPSDSSVSVTAASAETEKWSVLFQGFVTVNPPQKLSDVEMKANREIKTNDEIIIG